MALDFLFFQDGDASDPKLLTKLVNTDKHVGYVGIDKGDANTHTPVTDADQLPVREVGAGNFAFGNVSVGATATQIIAARASRRTLLIVNLGTTEIFIGNAAVTSGTGVLLFGSRGAGFSCANNQAVYGITTGGTQAVRYFEEYD